MLLRAVRRLLNSSLAVRQAFAVTRALDHVILPVRTSMATTNTSPPVVSIDDSRQSAEIEAILAPLRKAVLEQVSRPMNCIILTPI